MTTSSLSEQVASSRVPGTGFRDARVSALARFGAGNDGNTLFAAPLALMGSCIAILAALGFAVGLAYGGALLALDIAGVGSLLMQDGPAAVPIVLAGAALSFMPVVLVTGLATLPNVKR